MRRGERRFGLQSSLFVRDPWTVIRDSVQRRCPVAPKPEALACLEQARDFYVSAMAANVAAARPLQLYYCFLNLAKALALTSGTAATFDGAQHGLSERLRPGRRELIDAFLEVFPSPSNGKPQVFAELHKALCGTPLPAGVQQLDMLALLPQILPGHRLWADAARKTERFIAIHEVRFDESKQAKTLWLSTFFVADDLTRLGLTQDGLLTGSRLDGSFRVVKCDEPWERPLICFEQRAPVAYTGRPSDKIPELVAVVKHELWAIVGASPPYRRYYVYMLPATALPGERAAVLPQILSVYALMYYLGSITRYRPQHFDAILTSSYGSQIEEFIAGQPTQFIYLMASEFALREVTQPSIV
jgi:hypothetical protein